MGCKLTGGNVPDFYTIGDFESDGGRYIRPVNSWNRDEAGKKVVFYVVSFV